ncbi:MAG: M28 family peptidase [Gemmatimonadaceae bacterium]
MARITRRGIVQRLIAYPALLLVALAALWLVSIRMPGKSFEGPLPALNADQAETQKRLRAHVDMLAGRIGERNYMKMRALDSAATYIKTTLDSLGYATKELPYQARGATFRNLEATLPGGARANEIVVVGGHYDTVYDSPGADDNASGTAAVLELARLLKNQPHARTIRFVAFVNEEPPFFFTDDMGSLRYARAARTRGDSIVAMISMESMGYYSDKPGSQRYPPILGWFYPDKGNFIGVVGNIGSRPLVRRVVSDFRSHTSFPSAGSAAPTQIPGIAWSDQWSFWMADYDAVMITGTAPFRNKNYHEIWDRPDSLNYDHMARVVDGVARTVVRLAGDP